ncbi:MAG TPA: acyltransferase [Armatimonadota bacterium]|nr:acyltransferase [Armatimonadota bacterium]HOS44688.1 acyltransferase [Armatimonadota bacterium]
MSSQREAMTSGVAADAYIHPLAEVEDGARIGAGTKVWRFAHVRAGSVIGEKCMLGNCTYVDAGVTIGNLVRVQNGCLIYNGVTIEDEVFLGPNMIFTNDLYPRADGRHWVIVPTRVCRGASIGANATIVCGTTIGEYAMIAAGSVVTRDVPAFALARGNPARHVGYVCVCGAKLGDAGLPTDAPVSCAKCGRTLTFSTSDVR